MEKKNARPNPGVGCDVTACKYNTIDCRCTAAKISVQNENAASSIYDVRDMLMLDW